MRAPVPSAGNLRSTGMLVVDSVVPGSPCDGVIEAGDVLVEVNGAVVTHFLALEEMLDDAAAAAAQQQRQLSGADASTSGKGAKVALLLERGGKPVRTRRAHSREQPGVLWLGGPPAHCERSQFMPLGLGQVSKRCL